MDGCWYLSLLKKKGRYPVGCRWSIYFSWWPSFITSSLLNILALISQILQHLKIKQANPTHNFLAELITAYCHTVPWESASRIVRKKRLTAPEKCLVMPEAFWQGAIEYGTGGTCYESNLAFFYLLQQLGFDAYLTINSIADKSSEHTAIVVRMNEHKYIADVGYPMYAPVTFSATETMYTEYDSIIYSAEPIGPHEYIIKNTPHPKPYLFHLKDVSVDNSIYLQKAINDYEANGLFLDRIIIRKVKHGLPTRFDSEDLPFNIHTLQQGSRERKYIDEQDYSTVLSDYFSIDKTLLESAFRYLHSEV